RNATYNDFENLVRLSQSFPQLDSPGGTICEPDDKPLDSRHLDMVYALMTLSDKPFMGSVTSGPNAIDTIAMAEILFGKQSLDPAAPWSSARSSPTPTCSRAHRASAHRSRRSACFARGRSHATTTCRSAAAAR